MRQYVGFLNMNRELDVEIKEKINPLDINVKQDWKRNAPYLSKVLRGIMDSRELNTCDKGDDIEDKQKIRKHDRMEALLKHDDPSTTRPGKYKAYIHKFNITDTTPVLGHSRPVPYSARASGRKKNVQMMGYWSYLTLHT